MTEEPTSADDLVSALAYQRQYLLKHDGSPSGKPTAPAATEREAQLSAITASALEELRVAKEALAGRAAALAELRDELEHRLYFAQSLFDLAPASLLVTDLYGNVLEINRAMLRLLRQDRSHVEHQALARFIPRATRRGFRDGLTRIASMDGVRDWRMVLVRPTDTPIEVSATVQVVRGADTPSGITLFWAFTTTGTPGGTA